MRQQVTVVIIEVVRRILRRFARTHLRILVGLVALLIVSGTVGIYLAETPHNSDFRTWWDCLWWVVVTMSTVGYGDKVPITVAGRLVAILCMVGGPILLVSLIGSVAALTYDEWQRGARGMSQIASRKHMIICGWNAKAKEVIAELRLSKAFSKLSITIVDDKIDTKPVEDARVSFVHGNPSEVSVLEQANIREAQFAVVLAEDAAPTADQRTVLTVLAIKSMNPSILSCAELNDGKNEGHLRRAGCDVVVTASALTAKLLAMSIENPVVNKVIKELVSRVSGNEIYRVKLPQRYVERPFEQSLRELKSSHNVIVIGLERDGQYLVNPAADFVLKASDFLLVISEKPPSLESSGTVHKGLP